MINPTTTAANERARRKQTTTRLGQLLIDEGLITLEQLHHALDRQKSAGGFLGDVLVASGAVTAHQISLHLEMVTGFPFIDVMEAEIDREIATLVPEAFVLHNRALPVSDVGGKILVAMADPLDFAVVDQIKLLLGRNVVPCLALASDLDVVVHRTFDVRHRAQSLLDEIEFEPVEEAPIEREDSASGSEDAPVVRLVNNILAGAITAGASDIHIEPQAKNARVRYRIDGVMYEQMTMPSAHVNPCVSRLKVMAGMDIAERRRPQDGRFSTESKGGRKFDARISTVPTAFGEKACLRLLEATYNHVDTEMLGFFPEQSEQLIRFVKKPHGLVLVTGPTGSGKSTTLYTALQIINDSSKNINTIEDPIEYKITGINQVQVNAKIGLTFSAGLRTLVRQDPDVILVGEIRDQDTAEVAVQAALTGHLVLSTLHTNDAPGALIRLQNMNVEPYLITSAVVGVIGQRLLRSICPHCKTTYVPFEAEIKAMGIPTVDNRTPELARGAGCRRCGGRGTQGRTAAIEIMPMSDSIRDMVLEGRPGTEITALAIKQGMKTMRESAMRKVLDQNVPASELIRVFSQED